MDRFTSLKFDLLANGARVGHRAAEALAGSAKPALRVRSGSCGGLDLVLPDGTYVNCPVEEGFARVSDFELEVNGDGFKVTGPGGPVSVTPVPLPSFYSKEDSHGRPMVRSAQICFDRLGIGMTNNCIYWRNSTSRCQFCSIGLNTRAEEVTKDVDRIREAAAAAFDDPVYPAAHVLVGGGTAAGPDGGIIRMAAVVRALKELSDGPVYVMVTPPKDLGLLEVLVEAGVEELGINIELFDEGHARRFLPAKRREHGLEGYLRALARSVELLGPIATRSILIVGLEPLDGTLAGVELLAAMGVMPILSPFRPLTGTELANHPPPSGNALREAAVAASEVAGRHGIPLGPTCLACQGNTLNLPGHPTYRWYGQPVIAGQS
jgi:hypothetical protein